MKANTVSLGFALTADEYKKFKEICERTGTYPSAAIREAVMEWMEKNGR